MSVFHSTIYIQTRFIERRRPYIDFQQSPLSLILSNKITCLNVLFLQLEAVFEEKKVPGLLSLYIYCQTICMSFCFRASYDFAFSINNNNSVFYYTLICFFLIKYKQFGAPTGLTVAPNSLRFI